VAIWIIDLAEEDRLLASGAVTHAAAIVEIEIMDLAKFEYAFFVTRPWSCDS
jgi:hypothetical protein